MTKTIKELSKAVSQKFNEDTASMFSELDDYSLDTDDLLSNSDRLDDAVHEIADSNVSVYTKDRIQWLADNFNVADEENAIANGAKNCSDIAAYCWYEANREALNEAIEYAKELITE